MRAHLAHMALKNWAFSLFQPDRTLFHRGFTSVRPTPSVSTQSGLLTPDLVAWNSSTVLIIECCSGTPNRNDSAKAYKYSQLPSSFYAVLSGISQPSIETPLLYYEDKFESDQVGREDLLRAISTHREVIVWTCIPGVSIKTAAGSHTNSDLDSVMRGGAPLGPYPSPPIEIQPDSPLDLLAKVLFRRLFERAIGSRDTSFTLQQGREAIADQNYATQTDDENVKLRRAIEIGVRFGLCETEQQGVRWRLNFYVDRPISLERFLARLTGMATEPRLTDFGG